LPDDPIGAGALARFAGGTDQTTIQFGVMPGALDLINTARGRGEGIADADQELDEQRHRIGFGVRLAGT
jgi:hypothetical protein